MTVSCATNTDPTRRTRRTALVRGCIAILFVGSFAACTVQDSCDLYNNSDSGVTIIRSTRGEEQPPIHVNPGESIVLSDWLFSEFRVDKGGVVYRYSPKVPGTEFVISRGFGPWARRVFRAQIDSGGQIFVLKPDQSVPAKEYVEQPSGFPLIPITHQ